jgi:hypothetical protein
VCAVGDAFSFQNVQLYNCGDGWSWASPPGLGCWEGDVLFEVSDDAESWDEIVPDEMYPHLGRVVFPRALMEHWVRASGLCYPTSLIGWGSSWRITIDTEVNTSPSMTSPVGASVKTLDTVATVDGVIASSLKKAFVLLPFQKGAYVGFGEMTQVNAGVQIMFDDEGVTFEPYN